jgi:hypothetical protein
MKKLIIINVLILYWSTALFGQSKIYKLYDKKNNTDIDTNKFDLLNKNGAGFYLINKVFKPKSGKFIVYRFISVYKGISANTEKTETFHDLIILKTDTLNHIIEAYQYTLEWSEEPFTTDLYKATAKNLILTNHLKIDKLRFINVPDPGNNQQALYLLKDNGSISVHFVTNN